MFGTNTAFGSPVAGRNIKRLDERVSERTKERRNEGTKERRNEGTKERRNEGTKERRNEGTKERRNEQKDGGKIACRTGSIFFRFSGERRRARGASHLKNAKITPVL